MQKNITTLCKTWGPMGAPWAPGPKNKNDFLLNPKVGLYDRRLYFFRPILRIFRIVRDFFQKKINFSLFFWILGYFSILTFIKIYKTSDSNRLFPYLLYPTRTHCEPPGTPCDPMGPPELFWQWRPVLLCNFSRPAPGATFGCPCTVRASPGHNREEGRYLEQQLNNFQSPVCK